MGKIVMLTDALARRRKEGRGRCGNNVKEILGEKELSGDKVIRKCFDT